MIRILLSGILTFTALSFVYCQQYGNEWINYSQKYFTFKIASTGLYKIDYTTFNASNINVSGINTSNFQLFAREQQVPLFIQDGNDGNFGPGDYMIFYAEKNDGWLDKMLYDSPNDQGNPKYSLYNDTINYFFSWNTTGGNLRFTIETDTTISNFTPSNYIISEKFQSFNSYYNEGEKTSEASSSFYTPGEGWGNSPVNGGGNSSGYTWNYSNIVLENLYQGPDAPQITYKSVLVGSSNANYTATGNHHTVQTVGLSDFVLVDSVFSGYKAIHTTKSFDVSEIANTGVTNFKINIKNDQGALTDYQSINYWSFLYPKKPDLGNSNNIDFLVTNNLNQNKIRLDLKNTSAIQPLIFSLGSTARKLPVIYVNGGVSTLIPNDPSNETQRIIFQDISQVGTIGILKAVNGFGYFTNFASLNPEKALLMVYHPLVQQAANEYKTYRNSIAGGQYNCILANINELYLQFGGGIDKHTNGVRRFAHFMWSQATEKPVGLFLMGKGIREANMAGTFSTGPGTRNNTTNYANSLIPSFGHPSSDQILTSNLPGTTRWRPLIPTGRIAVTTNQELKDYLDKIKANELNQKQDVVYNTATKDWQKQILHFVGGTDANQQLTFQAYMSSMADVISNSYYGANVSTTARSTDNPLNPSELNAITDRIEDGVSLITFFGHASATSSGFEINIDEPINWNNYGKNPLVITNSCYNGNMFQSGKSKSETFVLTPKTGAIGYIGTVNLGFATTLYQYSHELYRQISLTNYGKPLGQQIQSSIEALEYPGNNLILESTVTQMALNGDPMLHLNWHAKPEIEINDQSVSFSPDDINLTVDSIHVSVELKNLGKSITDTFLLEVVRSFPNSPIDSTYRFPVYGLDYTKTVSFAVPLEPSIGIGINTFTIKADIPDEIDEQYDELVNNQVKKQLFITIDGVVPVIPYNFAVIPKDTATLYASTVNPIGEINTYRFEIDTIDFEAVPSSFHRYATVTGLGGIKSVKPTDWISSTTGLPSPLSFTDSMVYFWRVKLDAPNENWRESSFQYIPEKSGWGQDHFYQFKANHFNLLDYNRVQRDRSFLPIEKPLKCDIYASTAVPDIHYNGYYIDGQQQEYGLCQFTPSLYVAVIDPYSLEAWGNRYGSQNPTHGFGNVNDMGGCRQRLEKYFIFRQNSAGQLGAFEAMMSAIPDSHYILVYSPMTTLFDNWSNLSPTIFNAFQQLGSDSIKPNRPNLPFAFFCKKGDPTSVVEVYAQNQGENITLDAKLRGYDFVGQETSPLIGPAQHWDALFWKQDPSEIQPGDTTTLRIRLFDNNQVLINEIDTAFTKNDSILQLNQLIDASTYPYIQLKALYTDSIHFTPAQIDRWHVLFTPLPEAAIDGSSSYTWLPSTNLQEGEEVKFAVDIRNIFTIPMDSLLVNYWIETADQQRIPITYPRMDSLRVGQVIRDTLTFSTLGLQGDNTFWMEINPYVNNSLTVTDQPEQAHFNNLLQIPFHVSPDDKNPILDVTFDGRHIMNSDIVSPSPEILITLKDENVFQLMNQISDTALFGVYLKDPSGNQVRIPFYDNNGNAIMQWFPADANSKRFKIVYPAIFEQNGSYTLLVQGMDRSGNLSGDAEYKVSFRVIQESTITSVLNYPNPFSTSTKFVFTLTGNDTPDDILIRIMTPTGKVVREITEEEIGPIYIGRNITNFTWDGKDAQGDQLANGVYLYTVQARIDGKDIKHLESESDNFINKNYGKLYILR